MLPAVAIGALLLGAGPPRFEKHLIDAFPAGYQVLPPVLSERPLQAFRPAKRVPVGPSNQAGKRQQHESLRWIFAWMPAGMFFATYYWVAAVTQRYAPVRLSAFLTTVHLPSRIEVSKDYAANLAAVVKRFSALLGHDAMLVDLTEQSVVAYLSAYRRSGRPDRPTISGNCC